MLSRVRIGWTLLFVIIPLLMGAAYAAPTAAAEPTMTTMAVETPPTADAFTPSTAACGSDAFKWSGKSGTLDLSSTMLASLRTTSLDCQVGFNGKMVTYGISSPVKITGLVGKESVSNGSYSYITTTQALAFHLSPTTDGNKFFMLILSIGDFVDLGQKADPATGATYFTETGHNLSGSFLDYWTTHGGLAQFGYPLTEEVGEQLNGLYKVQYFERARFESHPENAAPYDVLLGQFGKQLGNSKLTAFAAATAKPGCSFEPTTGHNICGNFAEYWQAHGGLAINGYPISEAYQAQLPDGKTYTVQYFERARFESHPENAAPYDVLLGQFGRTILAQTQSIRDQTAGTQK